MRAAVQRTVFAVIGIDRFHGFLRLFQTGQLLLQLGNGLRVVLPDAAHAGAADFIKWVVNCSKQFQKVLENQAFPGFDSVLPWQINNILII